MPRANICFAKRGSLREVLRENPMPPIEVVKKVDEDWVAPSSPTPTARGEKARGGRGRA